MTTWQEFRKKTTTQMMQVNGPDDLPHEHEDAWPSPNGLGFDVRTSEGVTLNAAWGSWLAKDVKGGLYPISDEVQRASYEAVP